MNLSKLQNRFIAVCQINHRMNTIIVLKLIRQNTVYHWLKQCFFIIFLGLILNVIEITYLIKTIFIRNTRRPLEKTYTCGFHDSEAWYFTNLICFCDFFSWCASSSVNQLTIKRPQCCNCEHDAYSRTFLIVLTSLRSKEDLSNQWVFTKYSSNHLSSIYRRVIQQTELLLKKGHYFVSAD